MRASDDSHFDASGPVGRYWLANGLDFSVCDGDGRRLGVVAHVVVDRRRQSAERLIVRRRGLVRRPRYVALDPRAVASVLPDARLFLLAPAQERVTPASRATPAPRVRELAVSAGSASRAFGRASRPVVVALDRRIAAAAHSAVGASRRGANAGAAAAARAAGHTRREAPRLAAWLSARAHEARRVTGSALDLLATFARNVARVLADLVVLAAMGAVATWRRAVVAAQQHRAPSEQRPVELPEPDAPEWRRDADAPLAREQSDVRSPRRSRR
jgi:hypothetical protein